MSEAELEQGGRREPKRKQIGEHSRREPFSSEMVPVAGMMMLVGALRTTPLATIMTDAIWQRCTTVCRHSFKTWRRKKLQG